MPAAGVVRVLLPVVLAVLSYVARASLLRATLVLALGWVALWLPARLASRWPSRFARSTSRQSRRVVWSLQLVALAEAVALATGVAPLWSAPLLAAAGAVVAALLSAPTWLRAYRRATAAGLRGGSAIEAAATELLPASVLTMARGELRILRAAWVLVTPRPKEERTAVRLRYGSGDRLVVYVLGPVAATETVVMHYFLRNTPYAVPLTVLSLLSLPYLLGLVGRTRAFPHLLYDDRLVLRSGGEFQVSVPLEIVRSVRRRFVLDAGSRVTLHDGLLTIPSGGTTNSHADLLRPIQTTLGPASAICFEVDERDRSALDHLLPT